MLGLSLHSSRTSLLWFESLLKTFFSLCHRDKRETLSCKLRQKGAGGGKLLNLAYCAEGILSLRSTFFPFAAVLISLLITSLRAQRTEGQIRTFLPPRCERGPVSPPAGCVFGGEGGWRIGGCVQGGCGRREEEG